MSTDSIVIQSTTIETVVFNPKDDTVVLNPNIGYVITSLGQQGPEGPPGPQGIPGPPGAAADQYSLIAATAISGHRMITINNSNQAIYASNTVLAHASKVIGMSIGAAAQSDIVNIKPFGEITEPSWNWQPNQPIYLSTNGLLTQTPPVAPSIFSLVIGIAITSTTIFINIMPPIFLI